VAVATYPFTGNSLASFDADPLSTASSLSGTGLGTLGFNGIYGVPAPSLFLAANPIPNSFSLSSYLSFTITPDPGYVLNLDSFSLETAKVDTFTGSYTGFYQVRSSVDGFTSAVLSGTISSVAPTFSAASTTLGPSFLNLASVEFRIYIWDNNNGAKNGVMLDNITVVGGVAVIPEPSGLAAAAVLGLAGLVAVKATRGGARLRRARLPGSLRPRE
jgi:hypothetical protein